MSQKTSPTPFYHFYFSLSTVVIGKWETRRPGYTGCYKKAPAHRWPRISGHLFTGISSGIWQPPGCLRNLLRTSLLTSWCDEGARKGALKIVCLPNSGLITVAGRDPTLQSKHTKKRYKNCKDDSTHISVCGIFTHLCTTQISVDLKVEQLLFQEDSADITTKQQPWAKWSWQRKASLQKLELDTGFSENKGEIQWTGAPCSWCRFPIDTNLVNRLVCPPKGMNDRLLTM